MRTYVMCLVSAALTLLAFGATMFLQGGWQSAAAAFAVLAGAGFLTSLISLRVTGERLASPAPRIARGQARARHAPAAERPHEAAPVPSPTPEPTRPGPQVSGRLSPSPS